MCRVKDWDQVCFAARVRVSGECLFTVFSLKSVGLVGCLFISELDFLEKGAVLFPKNLAQHFADLAMIENEEAVSRPALVPQVITKI